MSIHWIRLLEQRLHQLGVPRAAGTSIRHRSEGAGGVGSASGNLVIRTIDAGQLLRLSSIQTFHTASQSLVIVGDGLNVALFYLVDPLGDEFEGNGQLAEQVRVEEVTQMRISLLDGLLGHFLGALIQLLGDVKWSAECVWSLAPIGLFRLGDVLEAHLATTKHLN